MAGYRARGTIIAVGDDQKGTPVAITAVVITNNVATVTATAHGLATGDVVLIDGVTGTGGIDFALNRFHLVSVVDANDFTLPGTYAEGTYTSGGTVENQNTAFASIASVRDGNVENTRDEIDVSTIDTPNGYREFDAGMASGTWTLNLNYRPNLPSHGAISGLRRLFNSSVKRWYRYTYPQVATALGLTNPPMDATLNVSLNLGRTFDMEGRLEFTTGGRTNLEELSLPGS